MDTTNIGIFYPQSICLYENLIKHYLLFFDKILFLPNDTRLNPGYGTTLRNRFSINDSMLDFAYYNESDLKYSLEYSSEEKYWSDELKRLMDEYDKLEETGIVEIIKDEDFSNVYNKHPIETSISADLNDSQFIEICKKNINQQELAKINNLGGKTKGGGIVIRPPRKGFLYSGICSEKVNTVLYFAEQYNATPITNHRKFNLLLRNKAKRCWHNPDFLSNRGLSNKIKTAMIQIEISRQIIPEKLVLTKSIKDILSYKKRSKSKEIEYQKCIYDLQNLSIEDIASEKLESEIESLVAKEIVPKINAINSEKKSIWSKLFKESIDAFFSPQIIFPLASMPIIPHIPVLSTHLFPNLSYIDILIYSTTFFGLKIAPKLANKLIDYRKIKKNSLAFLIDFK